MWGMACARDETRGAGDTCHDACNGRRERGDCAIMYITPKKFNILPLSLSIN